MSLTLPSCAQLAMCSPSSSMHRLTIGLVCCEHTGVHKLDARQITPLLMCSDIGYPLVRCGAHIQTYSIDVQPWNFVTTDRQDLNLTRVHSQNDKLEVETNCFSKWKTNTPNTTTMRPQQVMLAA